jgi:hypothetical protein
MMNRDLLIFLIGVPLISCCHHRGLSIRRTNPRYFFTAAAILALREAILDLGIGPPLAQHSGWSLCTSALVTIVDL